MWFSHYNSSLNKIFKYYAEVQELIKMLLKFITQLIGKYCYAGTICKQFKYLYASFLAVN